MIFSLLPPPSSFLAVDSSLRLTRLFWLHGIDLLVSTLASFWIAGLLVYFSRKRPDLQFGWLFPIFATLLLAHTAERLVEVWNFWHRNYWLGGGLKAFTAVIAAVAAVALTRKFTRAVKLPKPGDLERANAELAQEIETRKLAEAHARQLNAELEQRVVRRTAELLSANAELQRQIGEKQLAEEARHSAYLDFRASFHSSAVGQAQADSKTGRYLRVNARFCEMTGYSEDELLRMTFHELTHPDDREADVAEHGRMVRGSIQELHREKRYVRKDGGVVWIDIHATLIRDVGGRPDRTLAVVLDITERNRAEEEIRSLNAELEQRVMDRTARLEAANKEMEAFAYSVSHDLRAPLRAVEGFSNAALEDYGRELSGQCRHYLERVRAGAQKMRSLIDDLLTLSKFSRAPLNKREVNTTALVRAVLEDLRPQQETRHVELRIAELPPCWCDPALLRQVWENLLSNALKYSQKREAALIEVGCETLPEGSAFFVRDNGAGFDMQYAGKLFGVFQRLHRAEDYEGTGLGLAIVQRIVHRHGGRVWAEGEEDRGATFYFTLEGERKLESSSIHGGTG